MKLKKYFNFLLSLSLALTPIPVLAQSEYEMISNNNDEVWSEEYEDYLSFLEENGLSLEDIDRVTQEGFTYAQTAPIVADKELNARGIVGEWSWRDGVICVTDSYFEGISFLNHGHAGIVAIAPYYYQTVEALNSTEGVNFVSGHWRNRFEGRIYQCEVNATTVAQDAQAAALATTWAQARKPYSLASTLETTDSFYCSQLVYQAYRLGAGYTLPHSLPRIITPADLLHQGGTSIIYRDE